MEHRSKLKIGTSRAVQLCRGQRLLLRDQLFMPYQLGSILEKLKRTISLEGWIAPVPRSCQYVVEINLRILHPLAMWPSSLLIVYTFPIALINLLDLHRLYNINTVGSPKYYLRDPTVMGRFGREDETAGESNYIIKISFSLANED